MASFQMDFDINNLKKIIDTWLGSSTRRKIVDANKYYEGENVTVTAMININIAAAINNAFETLSSIIAHLHCLFTSICTF